MSWAGLEVGRGWRGEGGVGWGGRMDAYLRKGGWLKFGQVDICNYRLLKQSVWGGGVGGGGREGRGRVYMPTYLDRGGWLQIGHYTQVGIDKRRKKYLKQEWLLAF